MKSKIAVVTGGATGIGEAIVRTLCRDGFSVAIVYNSSDVKAKLLTSELSSLNYDVKAFKADVSSSADIRKLYESIRNAMGKVNLIVNNAGIAQQILFTDISDDEWNRMININLTGAFNVCRSFIPDMISEKQGRIINISSMWGQVGASCEVHYSASKAGLIGMTKALAQELAPSGITVNCVAPGAIETKMMASFSQEDKAALCEEIPMGRLGTAQEVAEAVAFLASEKASYITGQVLAVNGGMVV